LLLRARGFGGTTACQDGCGVACKLNTIGKETILHRFRGANYDGGSPYSALVQDAAANLYGTTSGAGAHGLGTAFKLDATGKIAVLHNFTGGGDGSNPLDGLFLDAKGVLYGATHSGGGHGVGTVFKLIP
jgi:uncharacterized repeat protein (TIGR03803 family)